MALTHLKHILTTKGGWHALERAGQVLWRFSTGQRRFQQMLDHLREDWDPDVRITFCVASSLLKRDFDLIHQLVDLGHAVASHGVYHSRMDTLSQERQKSILLDSYDAFQSVGIDVDGFRCPYLNYNADTVTALQNSPYSWTSQRIVLWENGLVPGVKRLLSLYETSKASQHPALPRYLGRILEIPITAPDDEMLVERYRIRDQEEMLAIWRRVFDDTLGRGELFHLLFHPERFFRIHRALGQILAEARNTSEIWFPTLGELTAWWRLREASRWTLTVSASNRRAWIRPPENGSIWIEDHRSNPENGLQPAQPNAEREGQVGFVMSNGEGSIGLSSDCHPDVEQFLVQEGYLVQHSPKPDQHGLYLTGWAEFDEKDRLRLGAHVRSQGQRLLRLGRWPFGAKAAVTVSSDIDSITLRDFVERSLNF